MISHVADDETVTVRDEAVLARCVDAPFDLKPALEWQAALRHDGVLEPLVNLTEMQLGHEEPLPGLLAVILRQESSWRGTSLRERLRAHLERFADSEVGRQIGTLWESMRSLEAFDETLAKEAAKLPASAYETFWFARAPQRVSFEEASAFHPRALQFWRDEMLAPEQDGVPRPMFVPGLRGQDAAERRFDQSERNTAFQSRAVRDGRLPLRDPETADLVEPFDSCQSGMAWQFSFGDRHLSVLMAAGGGQKAVFVYSSGGHEVLDLEGGLASSFGMSQICISMARILRRAIVKSDEWATAIEQRGERPAGRRRIALVAVHAENPMHHLWNLFPACEKLAQAGLASRVDELWTTPTDFYGDLPVLFPELAAAEHHAAPRAAATDPHPFSPDHLALRIGGYFMPRSLLDRVVDRMRDMPAVPGAITPEADESGPVVWFGLRVGSRAWLDQETEIPKVIDRIHERHPAARIVLDGYTRAVGRDLASARWESQIAQLSELAGQIVDSVARPDRIVDLSGMTLREATLWASVTDVYVTPSGSSQHKVGWFSDGAGIMYSSDDLAKRTQRGPLPGTYQAEGRGNCVLVTGRVAESGERRSSSDTRRNLENLVLDHAEIVARILDALDERGPRDAPESARR